jgi:lipopolysaccharide export system protein LptA
MDRGFRFLLRTALVLVLLAGAALVVHAVISEQRSSRQIRPQRTVSAPVRPAEERPAEAQPPSLVEDSPQAESTAAEPSPAGSRTPRDVEVEVGPFRTSLHGQQENLTEAIIAGERGVRQGEHYDVVAPIVDLIGQAVDGGPVDAQVNNVRITAKHGWVASDMTNCRLTEDVTARGEDFTISTQSVSFSAKDRALTSDEAVRIEAQRKGKDGSSATALVLTGEGLFVDVTVRDMRVQRDVTARLLGVSGDFLASRPAPGSGDGTTDVVITCNGPMDYEHMARQVVFWNSVRAVSGATTLTCEKLTILLGESQGTDSLPVEQMEAVGNVFLQHEDLRARGYKLTWNQVTQTGLVTGQPEAEAIISTPEVELSGRELTLYRVNDRIQAKGPGQLYWKAEKQTAGPAPVQNDASAFNLGPLGLTSDRPVTVKWQQGMKYDRGEHLAVFNGGVSSGQGALSLDCDDLLLKFAPEGTNIDEVRANGNVKLHDAASNPGRDIFCERMVWNAGANTVELTAPEGGVVNVASGDALVSSAQVMLDSGAGVLTCPAPGTLRVAPSTEGAPDSGQQGPPLTVDWQQRMDFHERPALDATFKGQVVAVRGTERIEGESLKVEFDADKNVVRAVAGGGAVIDIRSSPQQSAGPDAAGSRAVGPVKANNWHLETQEVVILPPQQRVTAQTPGRFIAMDGERTSGDITWQKSMDVWQQEGKAEFLGQTKADMSGALLESESLKMEFGPDGKMRNIVAEGNVSFVSSGEAGWNVRSETARAVFDAEGELRQVIAQGKVDVQAPQYTLASDVLTLYTGPSAQEGTAVEVVRAVAERNVRVRYRKDTELQADGDRLEWDRTADVFTLTGQPAARWTYAEVSQRGPRLVYDRKTGRARTSRIGTETRVEPF